MADAFAKRDEILSEDAFLELTSLTRHNFRRLVRADAIEGVIKLADDCYIIDLGEFLEGQK